MRVLEATPERTALCEGGVEVMTELVGDVRAGDELLVHAGVAIARVDGRRLDGARPGAEVPVWPAPEPGQ